MSSSIKCDGAYSSFRHSASPNTHKQVAYDMRVCRVYGVSSLGPTARNF